MVVGVGVQEVPVNWHHDERTRVRVLRDGVVVLRRRRSFPLFPLLVPIGIVLVTVAVTYANTRFRVAAEPMLIVLAAVAVDATIAPSRYAPPWSRWMPAIAPSRSRAPLRN